MSNDQNELATGAGENPMQPQPNIEEEEMNVSGDEQDNSKPRANSQ